MESINNPFYIYKLSTITEELLSTLKVLVIAKHFFIKQGEQFEIATAEKVDNFSEKFILFQL